MTLEQYIMATRNAMNVTKPVPAIICKDGFTLSVQANEYAYCSPRWNDGGWHKYEVGYPSERCEELMPYIDGEDSNPTQTVYGYVPESIIMDVINRHGGFADLEAIQ